MSENNNPATQRLISEDLNSQQCCCGNNQSCNFWISCYMSEI